MEKTTKLLKFLLFSFAFVAVVCIGFWVASKFVNITGFFSNIFGDKDIDVYAFDGADTNYNGGLSRREIDNQKSNVDCPKLPDIYDTLYIQDYNDFVCFYKETKNASGETIYPNIVFVKTEDGLKFNGALNIVGHCNYGWFGVGYSYKIEQKMSIKPVYVNQKSVSNGWARTNLFLVSTGAEDYLITDGGGIISSVANGLSKMQERINQTQQYVINNIYPHFLKFYKDNVEIIQDSNNPDGDFNYFYDYLYKSASTFDYGLGNDGQTKRVGTCFVNVSDLTVYPLPDGLLRTYPIPNTNPTEYFGVYNVKVYLKCNYEKIDKTSQYKDNDALKKHISDDPYTNRDLETKAYCTTIVKCKCEQELSNERLKTLLENSPIIIKFFDSNQNEYLSIVYNGHTSNEYNLLYEVKPFEAGTYTYAITSGQFIFNAYSGTVNIETSGTLTLNCQYLDGKVMANFKVKPVLNDIDYSNVDLLNYPVKLILNNQSANKSYQFIFDSVNKINNNQSSLVEVGTYTYTILSEKLIFGSNNGTLNISPNSTNFIFDFSLIYNRSDLSFSVTIRQTVSQSSGNFSIHAESDTTRLLGSKLGLQNYFVNLVIFDDNGHIVKTFNHTHSGSSTCNDSFFANELVAGTRYIAQMTYANGSDISANGYIEYQCSTFSFNYKLNTNYTFTYSCVSVE